MNSRHYGIDLARIFAMYLVVVFHAVGIFSHYNTKSVAGAYLSAASFCCVDLFGLISGYIGIHKDFKLSRFAGMWIQTVFTGCIIICVGSLLGYFHPSLKDWGKVFLPITSHAYWYLTSYFGLFLLSPFLNAGFSVLSKRTIALVTGLVFIFLICIPAFNPYGSDTYSLGGGLTVIWLVLLYLIGGGIRFLDYSGGAMPWFIGAILMVFPVKWWGSSYAHPTVILMAVFYLIGFSRIYVVPPSSTIQSIILFFSSAAFGVYIWHGQPLLHNALAGKLVFVDNYHWTISIIMLLVIPLIIYLVIAVLELVRIKIFHFVRIERLTRKLDFLLKN